MSDRITQAHLESLVKQINQLTGSPEESYTRDDMGHYKSNPGNYHLDWAYGGVNLARMCNDGGGITQPLGGGFRTKRELYNLLHAYIRGLQENK